MTDGTIFYQLNIKFFYTFIYIDLLIFKKYETVKRRIFDTYF